MSKWAALKKGLEKRDILEEHLFKGKGINFLLNKFPQGNQKDDSLFKLHRKYVHLSMLCKRE